MLEWAVRRRGYLMVPLVAAMLALRVLLGYPQWPELVIGAFGVALWWVPFIGKLVSRFRQGYSEPTSSARRSPRR